MPEVRVDPLSGLRTLLAPERVDRPGAWRMPVPASALDPADDPFLAGHEERTPPELGRVGDPWSARAVPNLYPLLDEEQPAPARDAQTELFAALPARGAHEVIVSSPRPVTGLLELDAQELALAMELWRERMRAHGGSACRHLMVNEDPAAGASQAHSHAQLLALEFVPALLARERERFSAYATRTMGGNLLADLLQEEVRRRERVVAVDEEAVLLAPYASRVPYALMLVPRRPRARFEDEGPLGSAMLAEALRRLAARLGASPPLNLWVRTAPLGAEHFCWRIDIEPRLTALGGLELGTGLHANVVAPEQAARELREL